MEQTSYILILRQPLQVSGFSPSSFLTSESAISTLIPLNYGFAEITHPNWQLPPSHPDCQATVEAMKDQ